MNDCSLIIQFVGQIASNVGHAKPCLSQMPLQGSTFLTFSWGVDLVIDVREDVILAFDSREPSGVYGGVMD